MSVNQETQAFVSGNNSTYYEEEVGSLTNCGCFRLRCFRFAGEQWGRSVAKRAKEMSEILAGPRWKNLLRKIGRHCNPRIKGDSKAQFMYDAQSYALNFDDGGAVAAVAEEDDGLLRNFSSRYAIPALPGQQRKAGL